MELTSKGAVFEDKMGIKGVRFSKSRFDHAGAWRNGLWGWGNENFDLNLNFLLHRDLNRFHDGFRIAGSLNRTSNDEKKG